MLVTIMSITGYSQDVNVYEIDRKSFTNQNFYQIKDLINFFIDDLEKFSKVYHHVNDVDESSFKSFISKIRNSEIISDFDLNQGGILGLSKSIYDDTKITISINPIEWRNSSNEKKLYVLYHELGHDILNFKHGEGGKMMFSLSEEDYSLYDFFNDRDEMFNTFLKGFLNSYGLNKIFNLNYNVSVMSGYKFLGKKITGYFRRFRENGSIQSEGQLYEGSRNGKWKLYSKNNNGFRVINYIDGSPEGDSMKYDRNGNLESSRFYLGSTSHYVQNEFYSDGSKKSEQEMKLFPLRKVGRFRTYFQNGNLKSDGTYSNEDEKKIGVWREFYENGLLKHIITYNDNGKPTGESILYFENGTIKESINYNENGIGVKIHYNKVGEKLNGEHIHFSDGERTRTKFIINYSNGLLHGEYITYSKYTWYDDDYDISSHLIYKDGLLNGKGVHYDYMNGNKSSEGLYVDGKKEGNWVYYGKKLKNKEWFVYKKSEGNYTRDVQDGIWTKYYENGYVKERGLWENGKFIKKL